MGDLLRGPLSRRRMLRVSSAGVAGGPALLLSACGDDSESGAGREPRADEADVEILNGARDLELLVVAAYKAAAGRLRGAALDVAQRFLEHEREHADRLARAIKSAGGAPHQPPSSYDLPRLRSERDALRLAVTLENRAIAAYIDALPKLSQGDLRATAAAILTTEAEHIAVLLGELGRPQAADAFVAGRA